MKTTPLAYLLAALLLSSCGGSTLMAENTGTTTPTTPTSPIPPTTIDTKTTDLGTTMTAGGGELNIVELKKNLQTNKEKWALRNISSYQYKFARSCFCVDYATGKKQVTVFDGVITEAFFVNTSQYLTVEQRATIKTVDQLFAVIEQAIDAKVYQLLITYNKDYGYPEAISIDKEEHMADDEMGYFVSDLM